MPWSTANKSPRAARLPPDWRRRRAHVLRRDGYRCQARDYLGALCGEPANQCDHMVRGDDHSLANLQALCEWHHRRKTAQEGGRASARARVPREREPERHPGFL